MAGYNGYSKSNNAIEAEERGLMTASAIANIVGHGATAAGVKTVLTPVEWHHTSCHYNCTDYFDYDGDRDAEIVAASKATGDRYRANVVFVEWTGSRRHPRANTYRYEGIGVIETGEWYTFYLPDGSKKRKKVYSTGTEVNRITHKRLAGF